MFRNAAAARNTGFMKDIKNEVPKILVYCNHIYIKSLNRGKFRLEHFSKAFNISKSTDLTKISD
jgi:hypothetical protein